MPQAKRRAEVVWEGTLTEGNGRIVNTSSGALKDLPITWASRVEQPNGKTSPEELLAAAHAECYTMSLSHTLAQAGTPPRSLRVDAVCAVDISANGLKIASVDLTVRGNVPGLDEAKFEQAARTAEQNCPVSNALRNNVEIRVKTQLEQ